MSALSSPKLTTQTAWLQWLPIAVALLILYVPTFYALVNGLWQEDEFAHGPIIMAVLIWLIWDKRDVLLTAGTHPSIAAGMTLLVPGLLFYTIGRSQGITILDVGSLFLVLAGILLTMRGWRALGSYWFMLLFIVYLLPLPGFVIDSITGPLKHQVSLIAEHIIYTAGYPIARSGVVLTVGQYQLLVADACSGLNSMFSLSAVGLLYLYLVGRRSWLHNIIIVLSLIPIAFCANVLRVMFLVLVTYHFGDEAGQGFLHGFSGMLLFLVALLCTLLLDSILSSLIREKPKTARASAP